MKKWHINYIGKYLINYIGHIFKTDKESSGLNIVCVPGFDSYEEFVDQYYRLIWYSHPLIGYLIKVYIATSFNNASLKKIPSYLDPKIKNFEREFDGKFLFFPDDDSSLWEKHLSEADILINWKLEFKHENKAVDSLMRMALKSKKRWNVDRENVQYEGSHYLKLSHDANRNHLENIRESRKKFLELINNFGKKRKGYIFGTGPSLAKAFDYDFSDGITIACNSMVKNRELLEHIDPKIIVIGDPIFHSGCSSYAGVFRKYLCEAMDTYKIYSIVPFRDYKLYIENLPSRFRKKIIGIPLEHIRNVNLDLNKRFVVKSTSNILTLFLIPIACTMFDEVGILGCDGRKIENNNYFWDHHKESQLNDQMENIKKAHPAFFKIDYNDYYLTHCQILEEWLSKGEKQGIKFNYLTDSYIPALQKRSVSV